MLNKKEFYSQEGCGIFITDTEGGDSRIFDEISGL
jgi:hypothetical protein